MIIRLFSIMFIFFVVSNSMAQQKSTFENENLEKPNKKTTTNLNNWKKIKIKNFSFLVPKNFTLKKKQGIETSYWKYNSDDIFFTVIASKRGAEPSISEMELPTFTEKSAIINKIKTKIWFFEYDTTVFSANSPVFEYPFVNASYFNKDGNSMSIYFKSKKRCATQIADKIFQSVKLTNEKKK